MPSDFHIPRSPIFLVGPTAVGKSEVALVLAEQMDAEIVSADAFQLYAGLDLLTAKPPAEALARVRHHLIGTFPLSEPMSVARYLAEARRCVEDISSRGRRVIVVGGTGLYLRFPPLRSLGSFGRAIRSPLSEWIETTCAGCSAHWRSRC